VSALSVSAEERDGLIVLSLSGNLDTYTTRTFQEDLRGYDPARTQLVIDLAGVQLLDSTGLRALVSLRNRAHRGGGRLGLICRDPHLTRLFWFTGLRPAFAFGDDLASVRSALATGAGVRVNPTAFGRPERGSQRRDDVEAGAEFAEGREGRTRRLGRVASGGSREQAPSRGPMAALSQTGRAERCDGAPGPMRRERIADAHAGAAVPAVSSRGWGRISGRPDDTGPRGDAITWPRKAGEHVTLATSLTPDSPSTGFLDADPDLRAALQVREGEGGAVEGTAARRQRPSPGRMSGGDAHPVGERARPSARTVREISPARPYCRHRGAGLAA
jgi:anti-anti-sigma factor